MKLLNVYCEVRKADVYISLDKIILLTKADEQTTLLQLEGGGEAVRVALPADEIVRKINGEDRAGIGFRTGR